MARSAFDDNVPRARPRLRLGRVAEAVETLTEPPPVAPEPVIEARQAEPVVVPEPVVEAKQPEPVIVPEPIVEPEPVVEAAPPVAQVVVEPPKPAPPPPAPAPAPVQAKVEIDPESISRRSDLRKRAASLGSAPAPAPVVPAAALEDFDNIEAAADLAVELERALAQAESANIQLRRDLTVAMDDLARATADSKRQMERADRLEAEARERSVLLQDLTRELELLESERDSALAQASDASLTIEELHEKVALHDRRMHEVERSLADALALSRRFEEAVQGHIAQRAALRAELDGLRRERDGMVSRIAELEREKDELGRSRQALDEVHRALAEAKQRAQRIRAR